MQAEIIWRDTPMPTALPPLAIPATRPFPVLVVKDRGDTYWFVSPDQIAHFCEIMSRPVLPHLSELQRRYGTSHRNKLWLSRIPKRSLKRRLALVAFVRRKALLLDRALAP